MPGWRGGQCGGEGGGGWGWSMGGREEGCRCSAAGGGESSCCAVAMVDGPSVVMCEWGVGGEHPMPDTPVHDGGQCSREGEDC